jgi:transposase
MALDLVLYDRNNRRIDSCEISESLHNDIFSTDYWKSYKLLCKLQDYYLTDAIFTDAEIKNLVSELQAYMLFLPENTQSEITMIIGTLSVKKVYKVHISGD